MEVKVDGEVYESKDATNMCEGCAARYDRGLCADINAEVDCSWRRWIIWIKKEVNQPIKPK